MGKQNERNKSKDNDWWTKQNDERNKPKSGDWWTKQKEKEDKEIDAKSETIQKQLARKSIRYGQRQQKWLCIEYKMGRSGQKFLDLNKV